MAQSYQNKQVSAVGKRMAKSGEDSCTASHFIKSESSKSTDFLASYQLDGDKLLNFSPENHLPFIKVEPKDNDEEVLNDNFRDSCNTTEICNDITYAASRNKNEAPKISFGLETKSCFMQAKSLNSFEMSDKLENKTHCKVNKSCNAFDKSSDGGKKRHNSTNCSEDKDSAYVVSFLPDHFQTESQDKREKYNETEFKIPSEVFNDDSSNSSQFPIFQRCSQNQTYSCYDCGKQFANKQNLRNHIALHTDEKRYSCSICGKSFKTQSYLTTHRVIHTEERPLCCTQCGKSFKTQNCLKKHLVSHSKERPFACERCGKRFKTLAVWKNHVLVHSEEKPYSCGICGKSYKTEYSLRGHFTSHSGTRSFSCDQCGKTFKSRSGMSHHHYFHSMQNRSSCSNCGEVFKNSDLTNHRCPRTPSKKKTYSFSCCGNFFQTRSELVEHLVRHTVEDPSKTKRFQLRAVVKKDPVLENSMK